MKGLKTFARFFIISIPFACLIYVIILSLFKIKAICGKN